MSKYKNDGASYLAMYPDIAKRWINECSVCHRQGYKPEMLEKIDSQSDQSIIKSNLMRHFQPLSVNELGLCEQCEKFAR